MSPAAAMKDYYAVLRVPRHASAKQIKSQYRRLAKLFHPDVNKDPKAAELFRQFAEAAEVLGDPKSRARLDTWLNGTEVVRPHPVSSRPVTRAPTAKAPQAAPPPPAQTAAPPAPTHDVPPISVQGKPVSRVAIAAGIAGILAFVVGVLYLWSRLVDDWQWTGLLYLGAANAMLMKTFVSGLNRWFLNGVRLSSLVAIFGAGFVATELSWGLLKPGAGCLVGALAFILPPVVMFGVANATGRIVNHALKISFMRA
jgi:hypothetical protein